jgi:hypothetical protein
MSAKVFGEKCGMCMLELTDGCCSGVDAVLNQLFGHGAEVDNDLARLYLVDLPNVNDTAMFSLLFLLFFVTNAPCSTRWP